MDVKGVVGAVGALVVLGLLVFLLWGGDEYARKDVAPDSEVAAEALKVLQTLVKEPDRVGEFMSKDAPPGAAEMVQDTVKHLSSDLQLKDAAWFGHFLRVGVESPRPGGKPLEKRFFFVREGGELRIRGLQL